ncbi:hypothetical protein PR048_007968 [Dryococelus australis]|uniref:PiggyBac transposable element-derived protein domain-containing protein n=1 Tax=Dryococelus australis TaxID=614101 RepID=A0ABQ9HVR7_9NEOP|nr:hypothetical protein PR048_007968 [Dryococelus australis]
MDSSYKKPKIIDFYNKTKAGVDSLDQKCATYTVGRRTRRWILAIWFAIMDIAAVNAHLVLGATKDSDNITCCDFLVSLGRLQEINSCLFLRTLQKDVNATSALGPRSEAFNLLYPVLQRSLQIP